MVLHHFPAPQRMSQRTMVAFGSIVRGFWAGLNMEFGGEFLYIWVIDSRAGAARARWHRAAYQAGQEKWGRGPPLPGPPARGHQGRSCERGHPRDSPGSRLQRRLKHQVPSGFHDSMDCLPYSQCCHQGSELLPRHPSLWYDCPSARLFNLRT